MDPRQQPITVDEDEEVEYLDDFSILDEEPTVFKAQAQAIALRAEQQQLDEDLFDKISAEITFPDGSRIRIKQGMSIEFINTRDVIQIWGISREHNGSRYIRGTAHCRVTSKALGNMLPGSQDELCLMQQRYPGDKTTSGGIILYDFCLEDLGKFTPVKLIHTNIPGNEKPANAARIGSDGTRICRWTFEQSMKHSRRTRDNRIDTQAFRKLVLSECSELYGIPDYEFREQRDKECQKSKFWKPTARTDPRQPYTCGDICCGGAIGASGAVKAGVVLKVGVDNDKNAVINARLNHRNTKILEMPVKEFLETRAERYRGKIDILLISFPCQPWSGAHTSPGKNDEQNKLVLKTLYGLLNMIKPRMVVLENTAGLYRIQKHRPHFQGLIRDFTSANYNVQATVLNLAAFGVPSKRERLIVIASAQGEKLPRYPKPTHNILGQDKSRALRDPYTVADALACVPDDLIERYRHDPQIQLKYPVQGYNAAETYIPTLTTAASNLKHPKGKREFCYPESLALQTADPGYELEGNRSQKLRLIGNAFPPKFVEAIVQELLRVMRETDRQDREYKQRLAAVTSNSAPQQDAPVDNEVSELTEEEQVALAAKFSLAEAEPVSTPTKRQRLWSTQLLTPDFTPGKRISILDRTSLEDEASPKSSGTRRIFASSQLPTRPDTPTPGPRPAAPSRRPGLDLLEQERRKAGVRPLP